MPFGRRSRNLNNQCQHKFAQNVNMITSRGHMMTIESQQLIGVAEIVVTERLRTNRLREHAMTVGQRLK
jgi:hypothetical protein